MVHVALLEPEIAGNAGNVARSCLAAGASLHLIRPLGFRLNDQAVRRAGMDYWSAADIALHASFLDFRAAFAQAFGSGRVFSFTTKGSRRYTDVAYAPGDVLLFGPESRGLPQEIRDDTEQVLIPMRSEARSLNLAVSVGIGLYECWRQLEFREARFQGTAP
jgi:tRNA (cytidine/uridine-2'-O-)-methyltransferase